MRVLVVGGTRFNGLALVHELVRRGHAVSVLNRGLTPAALPPGVERLTADRGDAAAVRSALAGREFDCVQDMSAYRLADVELMTELLRGRTGHYIFASSTVIYAAARLLPITEDHPVDRSARQNTYGQQKLLCEDHLIRAHRAHGFPASIAAFSMVFGPHNLIPDREQRMFQRLLRGRPVLIPGDGTTLGQVGHVDDQARALEAMMGRPLTFGKRYNLTGADAFSDDGYVDAFAQVVGVEPRRVYLPAALMDDLYAGRVGLSDDPAVRASPTAEGAADARAGALFQRSHLVQRVAPHIHAWNASVLFSIERLRRDVGWTPEYTLPSAVAQTYAWYRSHDLDRSQQFDWTLEDALLKRT